MARLPWLRIAVALLSLYVLAADVPGGLASVRIKLVRAPLPPAQEVTLPLSGATEISGPQVAFIYRARNDGAVPITIAASVGSELVHRATIPARSSKRVDLSWRRGGQGQIDLQATGADWTLEYAELASLHGFTRGAVEFAILPAAQPLAGPPPWAWLAWMAAVVVGVVGRPAGLGSPWRAAHLVLSAAAVALLAVVAIAPAVSSFRFALAPHTFAGCLAVVVAPSILGTVVHGTRFLVLNGLTAVRITAIAIGTVLVRVPWLRAALAMAFVAYGVMLWRHVGAYASGSDPSGYLHNARLISQGAFTTPIRVRDDASRRAHPGLVTPLGFRINDSGELTPTYPVGLPLMIAAAATVAGWQSAADVTMVASALAGVVLIFLLARACGLSPPMSALASFALATSPLYLFHSLLLMSDTPALGWSTAAVLLAWHSRRRAAWAAAAGAAVSFAVLVRPTNVLVFAPVAMCLGLSPHRWLLLAAGGAPGAALLAAHNLLTHGALLATGYVDVDAGALFGVANVIPSLRNYLWLLVMLTPIGILAPGVLLFRDRAPLLVRGVLTVWAGVVLVFFAFYFHTREGWWFLRFLLPAFPPLIVGALWVFTKLLDRFPDRWRPLVVRLAPVVLALSMAAHNVWWNHELDMLETGRRERKYLDVAEWTRANVPPGAAILAMQGSGALFYYTDFAVLRWDFVDPLTMRALAAESSAGRQPLYAVMFPIDLEWNASRKNLAGRWSQVGAIGEITMWRFEGLSDDIAFASGEH
jgi:hypothetical protein